MKTLHESIPSGILATPEERERAVAKWEDEIRPEITGGQPASGNAILAEAVRLEAERRLGELRATADVPIIVGEALRKVLDHWQDPNHLGLESRVPAVEGKSTGI